MFLLILILLSSLHATLSFQTDSNSLLSAIHRGIKFLEENKNELNLDALFGVQIARSQAEMIERQFDFPSIRDYKSLASTAKNLVDKTILKIIQDDPDYYQRIGELLNQFYWTRIACAERKTNHLTTSPKTEFNITEPMSDHCFAELFSSNKCTQSAHCKWLMMKNNLDDYGRAHQLLYLYIAFQKHCIPSREFLDRSHSHCTSMLEQNEQIELANFPNLDQDIFMENLLFCGYLGFTDFTRNRYWLKSILSWQNPSSGCFQVEIGSNKTLTAGQKNKRRDKIVGNRCSLHKTSIAIGAMTIIQTRHLLDQICAL